MSEPPVRGLQIAAAGAGAPLSPAQKRFNTLIREIGQARKRLADWQSQVPLYRHSRQTVLRPLRERLVAACREYAFALDALLGQPGWTRAERRTLQQRVCAIAGELLEDDDGDAELKALFDRHGDVDFDTAKEQDLQAFKELAESMTGFDLGDAAGLADEGELLRRMQQGRAERAAREPEAPPPAPASRRKPRSPTAAQQRREADAARAAQSLREVYRKLASALHPDRETDAGQRGAKTALMQRVNQAYAAGDLLALLELQFEIEQIDTARLAAAGAERLKHYNQLLGEQLAELRTEIARNEMSFRAESGVAGWTSVDPRTLLSLVDDEAREMRRLLARHQRERVLLADRAAVKRWLKQERRRLREEAFDDELPF